MKSQNTNNETHPDWYTDIAQMKYLILGSYPPHESKWTYPFYYPNSQNRFWKILSDISGIELKYTKTDKKKAVEERVEIMKALKTGVQNLGLRIERKGKSANDTDIKITEFQNIQSIIKQHPELETILLPGYSAASSTARAFITYVNKNITNLNIILKDLKPHYHLMVEVSGRKINCVVLNSTSTAARISYQEVLEQFKMYIR
jgi:hypoxanthine-DNA glycosylase